MKEKISRCSWTKNDPLYIRYHDFEWGVPVFDDKNVLIDIEVKYVKTFEHQMLEYSREFGFLD